MNREQFLGFFENEEQKSAPKGSDEELESEFRRRRLREELRRLNDAEQFEILFPVAVKPQPEAPSYDAALFLRELSPACSLSCEDAVRALLPGWDVSIEEVPFYLASKFGPGLIRQTVERLKAEITDEGQNASLKIILHWLDSYEASYQRITS